MIDKNFFVVNVGGNEPGAVHIEAEVCNNEKANIRILTTERVPKVLLEWTVSEKEVENLQNLFIFLRNELGINRLNSKISKSLQQSEKHIDDANLTAQKCK